MRYQEKSWSCGAASLANACRALGKRVSERRMRALCGTTENGTDETELIQAARALGLTATEFKGSDKGAAWAYVRAQLLEGRPSLLCVEQWQHWITAIGIVGDKVIVVDPANTVRNTAENGVWTMNRNELGKTWRSRDPQEPFYVLTIGK
jgi:ABC-type bacteriocin/lantibiotic exporter with double-glycine peptidase domain